MSFNLGLLGTALALTARADIVPGQDVAKADPLKLNKVISFPYTQTLRESVCRAHT